MRAGGSPGRGGAAGGRVGLVTGGYALRRLRRRRETALQPPQPCVYTPDPAAPGQRLPRRIPHLLPRGEGRKKKNRLPHPTTAPPPSPHPRRAAASILEPRRAGRRCAAPASRRPATAHARQRQVRGPALRGPAPLPAAQARWRRCGGAARLPCPAPAAGRWLGGAAGARSRRGPAHSPLSEGGGVGAAGAGGAAAVAGG